ncbi:hypothetical protein ILUMI_25227 [Ignelater luminosus]|uniref:Serrate RNA effector molecule homolog n=1 Tax=Ignelater luminosus TaxID=2038154 RepID=A0A8K0C8Y9_IGNLU|nr:hypothetical protein ILUMI_25227 [Ignelater luminosus]
MGDSDDEYDRKRRDKFRGERAEASYRGAERSVRPRDDWQERDVWSRPRPREYRGAVRDRGYSPSLEPQAKRLRHDYYGDSYYNHYQSYHQPAHREPPSSVTSESQQPVMMSFKAFLAAQDDNISDSEAVEKYNEYKLEFQRQQLNEFFVAHKDDEWFRLKYHPEDSVKRKDEQMNALKKRVEVFMDLLSNAKIDAVSVDSSRTNDLLKLLDTVVIKLEGGGDEDVVALEQEYAELEKKEQKIAEETVEKRNGSETATVNKEDAPTITRQEVEAMCSRYDGFLRVALADPQPERRWMRRGWVTFKRDANIKEICWNFNNIRLRDCELGAIVNRDLSRRIRLVNGITAHKQVVRSDIRISAKVVLHLDNKSGLWTEEDEKKEKPQQTFGFVSNNPVLNNITDYLIEEGSAEEEELLGLEPTSDAQDAAATVDRDDSLIAVLDKIILYLRVVHSVDYYNHCEYPNEDEMPNRCGILHARGPPPTAKTDISQFIGVPIEAKMAHFLPEKPNRDDNKNENKLINLALKDVDMEIDKFVQANTRELAKDKWLCPLSGKKFKGPDFVRKHIFNKHAEKIEEVKKEVEFFNNYLRDPKRPMLETPQPKKEETSSYSHPGFNVCSRSYGSSYGSYGPPSRFYNQGYSRPRPYAPPRTRGGGGDYRPVIHYRDLDAPREPEEFI